MIKYSNIKFVERKGQHFDTRFTASVDETRTTGFLWWRKEVRTTRRIASKALGLFCFLDTGKMVPSEVGELIRIHNHTCKHEERLEY